MSELPIAPPTVPPPRPDELLSDELRAAGLMRADAIPTTLPARFHERLGDQAVHVAERLRYLAPPS